MPSCVIHSGSSVVFLQGGVCQESVCYCRGEAGPGVAEVGHDEGGEDTSWEAEVEQVEAILSQTPTLSSVTAEISATVTRIETLRSEREAGASEAQEKTQEGQRLAHTETELQTKCVYFAASFPTFPLR